MRYFVFAVILITCIAGIATAGLDQAARYNEVIAIYRDDEALTFVYNPMLKEKVPETVQKVVAETKAKIIAGEIKVSQTYLKN